METFTIETDDAGGFQVRATDCERSRIVDSFPSYEKAQQWIDQRVETAIRTTIASDVA